MARLLAWKSSFSLTRLGKTNYKRERLHMKSAQLVRKPAISVLAWCGIFLASITLGRIAWTDEPRKPSLAGQEDRWKPWRALVGTWEGTSQGKPGTGRVQLVVEFVMNGRFLKIAGSADYKNETGGEHHEDMGLVSFDRGRSTFVFRQFHVEGFVNQYTLTSDPKAGDTLELTSESCENTPPGWRARETYKVIGDALDHTFELAAPDKPFERYATASLKRQTRKSG
jgi:hypothetical protein